VAIYEELRRRNVFKVAVAYAIVGWLIVQAAAILLPTFQAPAWIMRVIVLLLGIGFLIAVILTWAYELTPAGVQRTAEVTAPDSVMNMAGQKLNYGITGLLAVAVVFLLARDYFGAPARLALTEPTTAALVPTNGPADEVSAVELREVMPNSIAVLPFENLSPDPDNDYFAAGVHEEVLNKLVKLRSLNVIARTSVMQYAGAARPITEIARELNVGTIMEGSVSYANDRVAVAAQLIDAATGVHLWSERYNTELSNVFEVQADIAMNIANALEAEFSGAEQARLERRPTQSPAAYSLYLRSLPYGVIDSLTAIAYLDRALVLDPNFAEAYGEKALRISFRGRGIADSIPNWQAFVREAAEKGLELNSELVTGYAALANLHSYNWQWSEAERLFERAYQLSPNGTGVLASYATFRRDTGDYAEAIRLFARCDELDPLSGCATQLAITQRYARNYEAAFATLRHLAERQQAENILLHLAFTEIARGNKESALEHLRSAEELGSVNNWGSAGILQVRLAQLALAYKHVQRPDDVERVFAELTAPSAGVPVSEGTWAMAYIARGDYEEARARLARALENPGQGTLMTLGQLKANDLSDPVLEQPEWQALRARIGAL